MSYLQADKDRQSCFNQDGLGTKIVLDGKDLGDLMKLKFWAEQNSLPHYLVVDTGRNTTFNGVDTISAIGIGPLTPEEARRLRRYQLLP